MIAPFLAVGLFAAPLESAPAPFRVDLESGFQSNTGRMRSGWFDLGARFEWNERWLMDLGWSRPLGYDPPKLFMVWGDRPEPSRYALRLALGAKSRGRFGWLAAGGGWGVARLDTLGTYDDPRPILVEDADGPKVKTYPAPFSDVGGGAAVPATSGWVWNNRVFRSSPYTMVELGLGTGRFVLGARAEYRLGWGVGGFLQFRFGAPGEGA